MLQAEIIRRLLGLSLSVWIVLAVLVAGTEESHTDELLWLLMALVASGFLYVGYVIEENNGL